MKVRIRGAGDGAPGSDAPVGKEAPTGTPRAVGVGATHDTRDTLTEDGGSCARTAPPTAAALAFCARGSEPYIPEQYRKRRQP